MPTPESKLYMLRCRLETPRLLEIGKRHRLPLQHVDTGYLVHCVLAGLFGDDAPNPFHVEGQPGRFVTVLAYGSVPEDTLRDRARAFADPGVHASLDWDSLAQKPMPVRWEVGTRVSFRLRACPVKRMSSPGKLHRKGAEVDAFLVRCREVGPDVVVEREHVYLEWFRGQLERRGGAKLVRGGLEAFKRVRLVRRSGGERRCAHTVERPDALLRGLLEITDGRAFCRLLADGIGRHRSFGYGMLLLAPASRAAC
ncbi:MAG: type I-E CRISPR-associated protein Cas6/Cse3/CasE [Candidatus Eisenbacteria bacterium]|nr:type I-E CRISPR-associated protein Cas6/Cse3/CasE [Candidatus Eisenbacteria bacterium]